MANAASLASTYISEKLAEELRETCGNGMPTKLFQSFVIAFAALVAFIAPVVANAADRVVVEQLLVAGGVRPDAEKLAQTFENAYLAYIQRAKGSVSQGDREFVARLKSSLNAEALYSQLIDLHAEELTQDEADLALSYYRIQPPADVRGDKESIERWIEALPPGQRRTLDQYQNSDVGKSLRAKMIKVMLLMTERTTRQLARALSAGSANKVALATETECSQALAAGEVVQTFLVCSVAAFEPCGPCELTLARFYISEKLFPRDWRRTMDHMAAAARLNDLQAQNYYGRLLIQKSYPPAGSPVEGVQWVMLSGELGFQPSVKELQLLQRDEPALVTQAEAGFAAFRKANGL